MRRRLVAAFVGLTAAVIVLYGIAPAFFLAELVRAGEQTLVARGAETAEVLVAEARRDGDPVTAQLLAEVVTDGERVECRAPNGESVIVSSDSALAERESVRHRRRGPGAVLHDHGVGDVEPEVDVYAEERLGRHRVTVTDRGIGVPPGRGEEVFELFGRADRTRPGSGIALATAKRAIDAHGGAIALEHVPDGGTPVWFELPA
jgi:hypothetical protein